MVFKHDQGKPVAAKMIDFQIARLSHPMYDPLLLRMFYGMRPNLHKYEQMRRPVLPVLEYYTRDEGEAHASAAEELFRHSQ